jgi:excisionase family DNA binding protein
MSKNLTNNPDQALRIQQLEGRVNALQSACESLQRQVDEIVKSQIMCKEMLTSEEAALYLGISQSTLYKMTHNMEIPHSKPRGKAVYFCRQELDEWMRSGEKILPTKKDNQL